MNAAGLAPHKSRLYWPFGPADLQFEPTRRGNLIKAIEFLTAEVERIDREAGAE